MNIIFLSRKHGRPLTLQLNPRLLVSGVVGLVFLSLGIGAAGYWAATTYVMEPSVPQFSAADKARQEDLRAMAERMADIQARMMRIDALGAHLAENAKLKGDEFDFSKNPPMGGPLDEDSEDISMGKAPDRRAVEKSLSQMWQNIQAREAQLMALDHTLKGLRDQTVNLNNMPIRQGYITSSFGYRSDPFTGGTKFHGGIDFAGSEGTEIYSVADGVVVYAGSRSGFGNLVEIDHGDGMVTRYAHARAVAVRVGDLVSKDQLVAYMGSTGRSTGTHLHYEVLRHGQRINPASFIRLASR
ncbi:M23 family metallopeptidase [Paraperlucidibaca wandonensis]|uniref:M23 family metallopeptidase n=1 Tax=Paraperlucidibaca wandonensis TaxID=1268273 RepID=A0ABW3HHC2_9GAMM|nr:M23 family metallopeptidase [Paraperlucidibaca sp.]MBQ0722430.1 M23 family metallopeptidase [Paraperlucidibaca sp.]MBQ0841578.1 M23 family metallopeptidase [Paraperlucidibaca sp.]